MYKRLFVCYAAATTCLTLDTVTQASIEPGSIVALLAALAAAVSLVWFERGGRDLPKVARLLLCAIPLGCVTLGAATELAHAMFVRISSFSSRATARYVAHQLVARYQLLLHVAGQFHCIRVAHNVLWSLRYWACASTGR